ncbi:MAG: OmpA family protein, partial [Rhodocyclaceae bacterium]
APAATPGGGVAAATAQTPANAATAPPAATSATPPSATAAPNATPAAAGGRSTAVYFATGSAQLDATAAVLLREFATQLAARQTVQLNGYVDPRGKADSNAKLALARAQAVERALRDAGVAAERIELKKPADIVGGQDEARARRVDITAGEAR